ncbi:pimeloyl-ACP methyl ester carboxylesterase [Actinocorallia herbida]|uniref:Pimeloyl-ACP methyl ester carboxylesterase n=1 Tax=Actinocorallia herbida TaxID=58109 RepID=A0A3N1D7F4_9ACTN|nr:alpha/beta hydrolase [Actinocorallia herbida]ROO89421.1 pimeloyl-ACP methyl ester carboxylesterase [Actinocorallia herbida]
MTETTTIKANGIEFACRTAGPADGPLALLLHGFPDTPRSWRFLMPALADAGFRVAAPFMRGYAPTGTAPDGDYRAGALGADANALHEALGGDSSAVLVGHDWGAASVYAAIRQDPSRWRRGATLALPPLPALLSGFFTYPQLKRSFYIFLFQTPLAEMALDRPFVEGLWRDWSPGHTEDVGHIMDALGTPENIAAALGYYRAMLAPENLGAEATASAGAVDVPLLYLHGADDGCLGLDAVGPAGADGTPDLSTITAHLPAGSRARIVPGAGHFLQVEQPEAVNAAILEWL